MVSVPKSASTGGATRPRNREATPASRAGPSPREKNVAPAAARRLRAKEWTSPAARLVFQEKGGTCQPQISLFVSRSARASGARPSRKEERLAPAVQPHPGEKKRTFRTAQRLPGEKKHICAPRKRVSGRLATHDTYHHLISTRRRGRASGNTRFPSRDRVARMAQPVLGIEKELGRSQKVLFLPGKGSSQSEIANLDTKSEIPAPQNPISVPRRRCAGAHPLFSTRKSSIPAGMSRPRDGEGVARNAPGVLDSEIESHAWRSAVFAENALESREMPGFTLQERNSQEARRMPGKFEARAEATGS
jgi:hypothetical protein